MNKEEILASSLINKYKEEIIPMLQLSFPHLGLSEITDGVDYSIIKRMKNPEVVLHNSYKNKEINSSLLQMADYILQKEPIISSYGVLFKKHGEVPNPLTKMLKKFMENRDIYKKKMYTYTKGSELFEKYNLYQLLSKIDSNSLYGIIGSNKSIFYNLYVAASITSQGQSAISTAAMCFESFLANNVKFRSLDEMVVFINNVLKEERLFNDNQILDGDIDIVDCFEHIIMTCGNGYLPTEEDAQIVWDILCRVSQKDINRLFYKNNLFAFMENKSMTKALIYILQKLDEPYLNPNKVPQTIKVEIETLWGFIREYVFYNHGYIDVIDRLKFLPRACTLLVDTDSKTA